MKVTTALFFTILFLSFAEVSTPFVLTMGNPNTCELEKSICSIGTGEITNNSKQVRCNIEKVGERSLKVIITKSGLSEQFYFDYISTGYFKIESDFQFNVEFASSVNLSNKTIKSGKYQITETSLSYEVEVSLK
jgi:hypothetical protein